LRGGRVIARGGDGGGGDRASMPVQQPDDKAARNCRENEGYDPGHGSAPRPWW
jgi:hypothetical protein